MPCPLFLPHVARGDYSTGVCAAEPLTEIPTDKLRRFCNRGYARLVCPQAATSDADAAQFLIRLDRDGVIDVAWSLERNHHPLAVGVIVVTPGMGATSPLEIQAIALATAYLREKGNQK